ncbi:uncharacterized protein F4807DRAFT_206857 [Annulohypoxylon truncatum]|uniref:uncharacterized protein n=1 Tax=Annulohypoxylon truncatum TaxID=327061 RepID=UPI0020075168|nr:uncharacterized protein F4807DRAFT_206857 [Annulohypoxylon truncatum]KAI1213953.1 hypothetical protein F4807DRAFT_206857 [Annulohypoxylon truncatum]
MTGKPRMGTASFSRSTSSTLQKDPCRCLQPPSSASVTEWYNVLVPLTSSGVVGQVVDVTHHHPGDSTTIQRTGHAHWNPQAHIRLKSPAATPIWANLHMLWSVIRPQKSWVKKGITPNCVLLLFLNTAFVDAPAYDAARVVAEEDEATI